MKIRIELSEDEAEEIVIRCRQESERIRMLASVIETLTGESGELVLSLGNTEYYVPKEDILFFETFDGKVYAHTADGMYQTAYRLFELEEAMPSYFVRISKSVIANIKQIGSLRRELTGNGEICFRNSDKITYFSRAYYKILKDKIEEVRFSK
ncbi:MAG: LytTR family transcriptional regulator [Ruminococcaceae bacterium]|nr:LytTR family transcriptional regulator [Oscillospiraceae bacterium]